jgi:hypothetical protein
VGGVSGPGGPERSQADLNRDILQRLHAIEEHLGLGHGSLRLYQQQQQPHHRSSIGSSSVPDSVMINGGSLGSAAGGAGPPVVGLGLELDERSLDGQPESSLWKALRCLRRSCPPTVNPVIWQPKNIEYLWQTCVAKPRPPSLSLIPECTHHENIRS